MALFFTNTPRQLISKWLSNRPTRGSRIHLHSHRRGGTRANRRHAVAALSHWPLGSSVGRAEPAAAAQLRTERQALLTGSMEACPRATFSTSATKSRRSSARWPQSPPSSSASPRTPGSPPAPARPPITPGGGDPGSRAGLRDRRRQGGGVVGGGASWPVLALSVAAARRHLGQLGNSASGRAQPG